jgi:hypothetical protein
MNGPCDDLCCMFMCLSWCCVVEEAAAENRQIRRENQYLRNQQYNQYNQPKVVYVAEPNVVYQQGYPQPQQQYYQAPPPVVIVENRPSAPGYY